MAKKCGAIAILLFAFITCILCSRTLVKLPVKGISKQAFVALPANDHIAKLITYSGQYYEFPLLSLLHGFQRSGVYVDVGAHYGNHATFFAIECPSTLVVALEANPETYEGLQHTIAANNLQSRVLALNVGVHPTWRRAKAVGYSTEDSGFDVNSGMFQIAEADVQTAGAVPVMSLDEILLPLSNVAVIKVDAERSDHLVLQSGVQVLQRDHPIVAVEAQDEDSMKLIRAVLQPLGYRVVAKTGHTPMFVWVFDNASHGEL